MASPTTKDHSHIETDDINEEAQKDIVEKDMSPISGSSIHRSSSRPQLDVSGAAIQGNFEEKDPAILLPNQTDDISHLALDIGGSLIKLIYFSRHADRQVDDGRKRKVKERLGVANGNRRSYPILGGRLHFVKFETSKINECLDFIHSKQLHCGGMDSERWPSDAPPSENAVIKATGGGAYKFADLFKERLGVSIEKEDEMNCLVSGANFLLKAIRHEAFTHMEGHKEFVQIDQNDLFPYLLVNIGSGVSMIKVDGDGQFQRVSGTNVGGGTYWGLGRLLTKCKSFDELLELSQLGDNRTIDMLVGDIYGGMDYSKIGLSASTIASSFGKTISENKDLDDYKPEDISLSLLRMISYNIGQIAYLNALRFGLKRIFFGGFFIRGHAYTMDTISFAVQFWSKGDAQAMFLRHEGFLGALGAFMSYEKHGLDDLMVHQLVERFPMGAPYIGGNVHGPPLGDLNEKISWMEKFVRKGTKITAPVPMAPPATTGLGGFEVPSSKGVLRPDASKLNVGVLHLVPSLEVFPLLADPKIYEPNTIDLSDPGELEYWFTVLSEHLSDLVDKAVASEGGTDDAKRRGDAFARAFSAHLARLMEEPAAYGKLGLANLLELREECLREFHFFDAYRTIKQRENEASLAVLPDLLMELDSLTEDMRLLTLIEGVLAANIFDWGSRACVDLYHKGTIIEIYRMSRKKMQRPWRVDDFDAFKERMLGSGGKKPQPHKRALLFVGKEPWLPLPRNPNSFPVTLFYTHKSSVSVLRCGCKSPSYRRSQLLNCSNYGNPSSSEDDLEQGPPQEVVLKAISEVSKTEGRVGQTTNVVIGGTVHDDSTNEWLALDKKVNSYPTERGFTAIGTGGDDFVHSMVVAVESVIQQPVPQGQVRQKLSSGGKYVSVNIGPIQVVSSEQVQAVYEAMKRDVRMKYFL